MRHWALVVLVLALQGPAQDLELLRNATRAFQNLDAAVAAGYPREVADCLVHEHHGAMGYHHVNRGYPTVGLLFKPRRYRHAGVGTKASSGLTVRTGVQFLESPRRSRNRRAGPGLVSGEGNR